MGAHYAQAGARWNTRDVVQTRGAIAPTLAAMWSAGAVTPEELETMFEDAFVVRDPDAVTRLFEDGGLLATECETRSGDAIGAVAAALWEREVTFLADPLRVLQAHDT